MPSTYLGLPFDEEVFLQIWNEEPDPVKNALIQSGVLVEDSSIASSISTGSPLYTIPFYDTLTGTVYDYDGKTSFGNDKIEASGGYQTGVVYKRMARWFARDFAGELSQADPMGYISRSVAKFWQKQEQQRLLGILDTLFGVTTTKSTWKKTWAEHTYTTNNIIQETDLNDLATQALGDNKGIMSFAVMHSNVAKTLENKNLLEYMKYTDSQGIQRNTNLAQVGGYTILIDDDVPVQDVAAVEANSDNGTSAVPAHKLYTTYLLGTGAIRHSSAVPITKPVETYRDPYTNGGEDVLITRIGGTYHPNGFSFKVPNTGFNNEATDTQLKTAANWDLKFDPKSIPIARLVTSSIAL